MEFNFGQGLYSGMSTPQASLNFPRILGYEDARGFIWHSRESELMYGSDGQGKSVTVNLDSDAPHVLVSAGSGAGKSVTARALATQGLLKGYVVVILDSKRHSHRWAKNLPNVHYASTMEEIGNALVSVAMEMYRRNEIVEYFPGPISEAPVGPRILVLFEEMNSTMAALKELDRKLPPRGVYTARQAFGDIMFLGRAAKTHVLAVAQYADSKTISTDVRENFGDRVLIRHTSNSWNMLAWACGYCPPAPQQVGRGFVVRGDKARETQFLYMEEEECAALVRHTHEARERAGMAPPAPRRRDLKRQERAARRALMSRTGTRVGV